MRADLLKAVCFDIGGTLVEMERGTLAEEIAARLAVDQAVVRDLLIEHGKRKRTSPADLAAVVAGGLGRPEQACAITGLIQHRRADVSQPRLCDDAVPTVRALARRAWRILYLSNAVGYVDPGPRPSYYDYAELVLHSWEIGACTPDPAAFRAVTGRTGLEPHSIVHVGDSWDTDVMGALAAGWQAIHVSRQQRDTNAPTHPRVPRISRLTELIDILPWKPRGEADATTTGSRG
jgi:FMN phosphatase YigB (HAD superfamily)